MTLKTLCQDAISEIGTFDVPETFFGNTDNTAKQCRTLATAVGKALARKYHWQVLQTSYTFATTSGTASYDLPSDFGRFSNLTFWDRTNYWEVRGPATPTQWQTLNSSVVSLVPRKVFRIAADQFVIYPTPSSTDTIAYDYQSKNWCEDSGGTAQSAFAADDDVSKIDEELIKLGVKYRFLSAKGRPYGEEKEEFDAYLSALRADDEPHQVIDFGQTQFDVYENVPNTGLADYAE